MVYKVFSASFEDLLAKDKSVTIHNLNLQQQAIEIFKVKSLGNESLEENLCILGVP